MFLLLSQNTISSNLYSILKFHGFTYLVDKSVKITFKIAALGLSSGWSFVHKKKISKSSSYSSPSFKSSGKSGRVPKNI